MNEMEQSTSDGEPTAPQMQARGGIYELPGIGGRARAVRSFYDDMEPTDDDSVGVTLGKNTVRYGTVAAAGVISVGAAAIVCL